MSEHNIEPRLIPRSTLFGNPDHLFVRLSPDGQYISYIAPYQGVLNIWVAPKNNIGKAKVITNDSDRGIRSYFWAYTNNHIVYVQDREGNEDWHIYCVDLKKGETVNLTPTSGVQARILEVSEHHKEEILVAVNDRDPTFHDVYKMNIVSKEKDLIVENTQFAGFVTDSDLNVRFAIRQRPDGGNQILQKDEDNWTLWAEFDPEDTMTSHPLGFNKADDVLYLVDSRGHNTACLYAYDLNTDEKTLIYENPKADISDIIIQPREKTIQAASATYERKEWTVFDKEIEKDLEYLKTVEHGDLEIVSRSLEDEYWITAYLIDDGPVNYFLYNRKDQESQFLFHSSKSLSDLPLTHMHPVTIKSRDGLDLVCYYSLPLEFDKDKSGIPSRPIPLVLDVHGGPWARDSWGYNPIHQWLTNRGYAVLNVNFRGSTGLGKKLANAGNGEWAKKMQDDLMDAVEWTIQQKIADPNKIAIMGGSYGGYAVLTALTRDPDFFTCGIDIVGPSNLETLIASIPPYWRPILDMFLHKIGANPETAKGRAFLKERSPITYADRIRKPLLIGQGANDPRVKQAESDQIVKALQEKRIAHTYILFPDEGHGFVKPENRLGFYAISEAFLAQNLGGRCEPLDKDLKNSSHEVVSDSYNLLHEYAA